MSSHIPTRYRRRPGLHCSAVTAARSSSALALAVTGLAYGQTTTNTPPVSVPASTNTVATPTPPPTAELTSTNAEPGTLNSFFNGKLPDAIGRSKINLNARLRYEFADQEDLDPSNALTLRTRFGITSGELYGFQGMLEGENVTSVANEDNYNAAGTNDENNRTVVADPPMTQLNQAWLRYSNWDSNLKGGRQRYALDNHRFIGDVGWRQNDQTFDAAALEIGKVKDLNFRYAYLWEVNRVFGDVDGLPPALRDFESNSHVINVDFHGWEYGRFVGYTYLLDLENSAGNANSCATYGGFFAGSAPVSEKVKLDYRAEFAWQTAYADSPQDYQTEYYHFMLGANVKPFVLGAGYEVLGSGSNDGAGPANVGFRTPLATLHAFNGWADVFLNTPNDGLRDFYAFAQVTLPGEIPFRFVYHLFNSDTDGLNYGQEFDFVLSKKLGKYWNAMAKYAFYDAQAPAPPAQVVAANVQKFWLQLEFNF